MSVNPPAFSMPFNYDTLDTSERWIFEREHPTHGDTRARVDYFKIGAFGGACGHVLEGKRVLRYVSITMPDSGPETVNAGNIVFNSATQPHPESWQCYSHVTKAYTHRYFHHPDYVLYPSVEEGGWFQHKDVVAKLKAEAEAKAKADKKA